MKKLGLLLLVITFFTYSCSKEDIFTPDEDMSALQLKANPASKTIKFHKSWGTIAVIPGPCDPYYQILIEGEGNASHLGHFTVQNTVCFDGSTFIGDWEGILTAANGDQLFTEMINGPYTVGDDGLSYYDYVVHYGNGRFAGVTGGELTMYGTSDMALGVWELEGEGVIYY